MSVYATESKSYQGGGRAWSRNFHDERTFGGMLDGNVLPAGVIKSGTALGRVTATGRLVKYDDAFDADAVTAGQQGDGRQTCVGLLGVDVDVKAGAQYHVAVVFQATVIQSALPTGHGIDAAAKADLPNCKFI